MNLHTLSVLPSIHSPIYLFHEKEVGKREKKREREKGNVKSDKKKTCSCKTLKRVPFSFFKFHDLR